MKGLKKILKMKSGDKYFSLTDMGIRPMAMNKTIVKINKTTTILNNFRIAVNFILLSLGLKASCLAKKNQNSLCPNGQAKQKSQ